MIRWMFRILLSLFFLSVAASSVRSPATWPWMIIFFVAGSGVFLKAIGFFRRQKCPECGKTFARDKEKVIRHPVRFWQFERRITRYNPCKECHHRMDVRKEVKPRYWFDTNG